ncbi:hypothetical protein CR513_10202, partial [Mucuna pruriens]
MLFSSKVVGDDLCQLVESIFNQPNRVEEINDTLITLISKVELAIKLPNFKPINFCNVSYKVITKVLVQKPRIVIEQLHCYNAEIFHSIRSKMGNKG